MKETGCQELRKELKQLCDAYDSLRERTQKSIKYEEDEEEEEETKSRVGSTFLVAEKAFLYKEILDCCIEEISKRSKCENVNYSIISKFLDEVIDLLVGKQ